MDGLVNNQPFIGSLVPPDAALLYAPDSEVTASYVKAQKLAYIRACRTRRRGSAGRLRLLTPPARHTTVYPRESKRGLSMRHGLNRSLDGWQPRLETMERAELHRGAPFGGYAPAQLGQTYARFGTLRRPATAPAFLEALDGGRTTAAADDAADEEFGDDGDSATVGSVLSFASLRHQRVPRLLFNRSTLIPRDQGLWDRDLVPCG